MRLLAKVRLRVVEKLHRFLVQVKGWLLRTFSHKMSHLLNHFNFILRRRFLQDVQASSVCPSPPQSHGGEITRPKTP